ncbi:unnamed protein product [Closterium sp. Yama58-4]|nr:unnamed protein product [Closterium sp. Yama58-4]
MKTQNGQGVILHSIRTKAVEFHTKYSVTREKSAASVASVHLGFREDFIKSKESEELERQRIKDAEELKKAAAAEEMEHLETDLAINELVRKAAKKHAEAMCKEVAASVEAKLTAKFKKSLSMGSQDFKPAPTAAKPKADPSKDRQMNTGAKAHAQSCILDRGVHNLSAKVLPRDKSKALGTGLKFIPTSAWKFSIEANLHQLHRRISLDFFFKGKGPSASSRFRVKNPNWWPDRAEVPEQVFKEARADLSFLVKTCKPLRGQNLSRGVRAAIRSLSLDSSIVIKAADKHVGVTVMDRAHYVAMCMEHLSDADVYRPVRHDPTPRVLQQLSKLKTTWGPAFPNSIWKFFFDKPPGGWRLAAFYILPKLHKKTPVGRPIAALHSWVTTNASRWLDAQLRPLVLKRATYLRNSLALLAKLETTAFPPNILLATYDVTSLYPSISIDRGLEAVSRFLTREKPAARSTAHGPSGLGHEKFFRGI